MTDILLYSCWESRRKFFLARLIYFTIYVAPNALLGQHHHHQQTRQQQAFLGADSTSTSSKTKGSAKRTTGRRSIHHSLCLERMEFPLLLWEKFFILSTYNYLFVYINHLINTYYIHILSFSSSEHQCSKGINITLVVIIILYFLVN